MAKITINPVQSGNGLETAINLRLQQIEDTFNDNVLWRAGFAGEANQMNVDLDMNENDILNLLELTLGSVNVKADILQNQSDISDLKTAVNILWPDTSPPFPGFNVRWGTIEGDINDQTDLKAWLDRIAVNETDIAAETTARIAADSTLQSNIDTEEAARIAEDATFLKLDGTRTMTGPIDTSHGGFTSSVAVSPSSPAFDFSTTQTIYNLKDGTPYAQFLDAGGKGWQASDTAGIFGATSLQIKAVGYTGTFDSLKFRGGGVLGQILFTNDAATNEMGFNPGGNSVITKNTSEITLAVNYGGTGVGRFTTTSWEPIQPNVDIGTATADFRHYYSNGNYFSQKTNGASTIAFDYRSLSLTTAGAKMAQWHNAGVPVAAIDKDGQFSTQVAAPTAANHLARKDYVDGLVGGVRVSLGTFALSGLTQIFITGIPATATRIIIQVDGVALTSGSGGVGIQLANTSIVNQTSARGSVDHSVAGPQTYPGAAYLVSNLVPVTSATALNGVIELSKQNAVNSWYLTSQLGSATPAIHNSAGIGLASSVVDSLRFYRTGTGSFNTSSNLHVYYEV